MTITLTTSAIILISMLGVPSLSTLHSNFQDCTVEYFTSSETGQYTLLTDADGTERIQGHMTPQGCYLLPFTQPDTLGDQER